MAWEAADEEEKEKYTKKAKEMAGDDSINEDDPSSRKKTIRTLIKQLEWAVSYIVLQNPFLAFIMYFIKLKCVL